MKVKDEREKRATMSSDTRAANSFTSPLVGEVDQHRLAGVDREGGNLGALRQASIPHPNPPPRTGEGGYSGPVAQTSTPLPNPPPQGGREKAEQGGREKVEQGGSEKAEQGTRENTEQWGRERYGKDGGKPGRQQKKRDKRDVHGWVVLDKPVGMTSTHAVSIIKRLFSAKRCGHAGTLDPLASGALPIALGEATKTVPFVMDGRKLYRFTIRWGEERDTDDSEGRVIAHSDQRPTAEAIGALLPAYRGIIQQVPPRFSAIKIEGERAYDLARNDEVVTLAARPVEISRLELVSTPDVNHAVFEAECGKGTYVRSLARDMGRALGCYGHISALRRTTVGPFRENCMISLEDLEAICHRATVGETHFADALMPVETALDDIPALAVSRADAARLAKGQAVLLRGRDAPNFRGAVQVTVSGQFLALAELDSGEIVPKRIFNLSGIVGRAGPFRKG